ncbi:MAG: dTDP-4-dehydrorhamnose 3,5-epimerase [Bacteroidota bacterium]
MTVKESPLKDCYIIEPRVIEDERGYFYESFNLRSLEKEIGYAPNFVQDNQSKSKYGVLRGLHLQLGEYAQAKLVRALEGEILDVVVDGRVESPTFGKHFAINLSAENKTQLFIPRGFAHGFAVLSETAIIHYKADNYYFKDSESGLKFDDPDLNIDWQIPSEQILTSERDQYQPSLKAFRELLLAQKADN